MKIGITCYPTDGGSGAIATELGVDLADRGHEVHFISYAQPFRLEHFRERIVFHEVEMDHYPLFEHPAYSRVLFLAKHRAVDELLACADLFLLPSRNESFGLAAQEALACGAPVIATNTGGIPEVVIHGETDFLVPLGAVEEMAEAGISLLKDSDRWTRFSEAGRSDAVERFSIDRIVPLYEGLYQDVLRGEFGDE